MIPKSCTETNFSLLLERVVQVLALCDTFAYFILSMMDVKKSFRLWYLVSPIGEVVSMSYFLLVSCGIENLNFISRQL